MGEARRRGAFGERKAQALAAGRLGRTRTKGVEPPEWSTFVREPLTVISILCARAEQRALRRKRKERSRKA